MPTDPHVLIIGAGLTGLFIAQGLKKAGIRYTIFEAEEADTFRPREWTMGVHWGVPLLEKLLPPEFADRLIPEACVDKSLDYVTPPQNGSRIYDGVTGKVLKELVSEGKLLRVSRRKLRKLVWEGLDVRFGWKVTDVRCGEDGMGVKACFENGEVVEGTVLVGADGPKSFVRGWLFNFDAAEEAKPLAGVVHLSTTFAYGDAEKSRFVRSAHPVWSIMIHPDIFTYICIQDVPDADRPEDWTFFVVVCWLGEKDGSMSMEEVKRLAKMKAAKIQEPFRSAIQWIPDDVELGLFDIGYWVANPWNTRNGRVTLAGDAAHPMPPYRGQGLNHAIQDAWNFVELMKKVEDGGVQERLVQDYSDEVAKRGGEETSLSMKNAYMLLSYEDFKESPYMKHGLSKQ